MNSIQQRIPLLLNELQQGIYEKETEISLALLAALAGESILLLGPPGVAKSMVARRLTTAFSQARSFEYLMSRFSTPDELFGPVSISRLKTSDSYERCTEGYLPAADVVFLDEIWKAGPAIQNSLLTVMNEKLFRNGNQVVHIPLKLLVAASNELPAKDEGLEALWDRFMIRIICHCIENENTFRQMLTEESVQTTVAPHTAPSALTPDEYSACRQAAQQLRLSESLLDAISQLRQELRRVTPPHAEMPYSIYISDRRWKHIAALLRTSAYIQGRNEAQPEDLLPLYHCLWNRPEEISEVQRLVTEAVFGSVKKELEQLALDVQNDLRACRAQEALRQAERENDHRDDNLLIVDKLFYQIENHGTGHTCIFITDFKRLPEHGTGIRRAAPTQGVIYTDPRHPQRSIVRIFDQSSKIKQAEQVTLSRDQAHIYINGVRFAMQQHGSAQLNPAAGTFGRCNSHHTSTDTAAQLLSRCEDKMAPDNDYENKIENICTQLDNLKMRAADNLFASHADRERVNALCQKIYQKIALTRADIRKLLYHDA